MEPKKELMSGFSTGLKQFDHFTFRARLQPAFLSALPVAIGILAWSQPESRGMYAVWSILTGAGFPFFLSTEARNRGKALEPELYKQWGGIPTTQLLRHSGPANSVLRDRWHNKLSKLVGKTFPTSAEEAQKPLDADSLYEAATKLVIEKTRNVKQFPFVYRDNVNYNFCRNLLGLKKIGLGASSVGLLVSFLAGLRSCFTSQTEYWPWACTIICALFAIGWRGITPSWVKVPAFSYAEHLFAALDKIPIRKTAEKEGK